MLIGLPLLALVLVVRRIPFRVPRNEWRELLVLAFFNMLMWHALIIFAVGFSFFRWRQAFNQKLPPFWAVYLIIFGIP